MLMRFNQPPTEVFGNMLPPILITATLDNLVISNQLWQISHRLPAPAISSDSIKRKNFVITLGASIQLTQCCSTICFQIAYINYN